MTPAELLAEIERLEKVATPGPWSRSGARSRYKTYGHAVGPSDKTIAIFEYSDQEHAASLADPNLTILLRNNLLAILSALRGVGAARVLALKHGISSMVKCDDATGEVEFGWVCCNECLAQAVKQDALAHEPGCALAALSEKVTPK